MQTPITHSCGHRVTHNLFGSGNERSRREGLLAGVPCHECKRTAEKTTANDQAALLGLPALTGSEKQVDWAIRIRSEFLAGVEEFRAEVARKAERANATPEQVAQANSDIEVRLSRILAHAEAKWWIDSARSTSAQSLLRNA